MQGETGTGKAALARAVHELSGRPGPFIAMSCSAMAGISAAERQLELEGRLLASKRGTLFLDDIGELPPGDQALLLRALDEGGVWPDASAR